MIQLEFRIEPDGCTHYRVIASRAEDWSGWAKDFETAVRRARARESEIRERLGDEGTCPRLSAGAHT